MKIRYDEMLLFKIDYQFRDDEKTPDTIIDRWDIGGCFRVTCNDIILTKSISEDDDGYFGFWLDNDLTEIIGSIEALINGDEVNYEMEFPYGFHIELINDQVFFSLVIRVSDEKEIEEFKRDFAAGAAGCYIPVKIYFNEVLRVGYEFLNDIEIKYKNYEDFEHSKEFMERMRKLVEEYNKTH